MIAPRLFLCSGARPTGGDPLGHGKKIIALDSIGQHGNVNIRLENVAKILNKHVCPRLVDLLEIASYVFTGDCATNRGQQWTDDQSTEAWDRDLSFVIPVRDLQFWQQSEVQDSLREILSFLSDDKYSFVFLPIKQDQTLQDYLNFGDLDDWPFYGVDRVLMFSGGLDSLAGALETGRAGHRTVLVSYRSVTTLDSRQRRIFQRLDRKYPGQMIHVPVWINKETKLGRESTQRTRSFLYSALGTIIAESIGSIAQSVGVFPRDVRKLTTTLKKNAPGARRKKRG